MADGSGTNSGNSNSAPSQRAGMCRGIINQSVPATAQASSSSEGSGVFHCETGNCARCCNNGQVPAMTAAASLSNKVPAHAQRPSSATPARTSGTTSKLYTGTATMLASGETSVAR